MNQGWEKGVDLGVFGLIMNGTQQVKISGPILQAGYSTAWSF